jgi:hypothetical protein
MTSGCGVADVISINSKLNHSKRKQAEIDRMRKILAVQKIFQCTQCAMKREKCGTQIAHPPPISGDTPRQRRIPYRFCESCTEEYVDYIERMKGGGDPDCYWRNEDWLAVWKTWIDYQGARDRYVKSKGFARLLQELKQPHLE